MSWIRDRSLGLFFIVLFLLSWLAQLVMQWYEFVSEQRSHEQSAGFWSGDFWFSFGQATFENWQSEFLQVASFVIAATYFVYKGSSESPDGEERVEAKLDALLRSAGIDPEDVHRSLPEKYRPMHPGPGP
jgi:hypothetical protein